MNLNEDNKKIINSYILLSCFVTLVCLPAGAFAVKYAVDAQEMCKTSSFEAATKALQISKRLCVTGISVSASILLIGLFGWSHEWISEILNNFSSRNHSISVVEYSIVSSLVDSL